MRASDADRQRVVGVLQRHTEAGRLTLEEFSERVGAAYAARTLADLAALVADLPAEPGPARPAVRGGGRQLIVAFAGAVVVPIILGLAVALR